MSGGRVLSSLGFILNYIGSNWTILSKSMQFVLYLNRIPHVDIKLKGKRVDCSNQLSCYENSCDGGGSGEKYLYHRFSNS